MTTTRPDEAHSRVVITCSGCGHTWTAPGAAHCGACHRLFSAVGIFDTHRSAKGDHGTCINPEDIVNSRTGYRTMFFRDGMWRGREVTSEQRIAAGWT